MGKTIDDVSQEIAQLKNDLATGTVKLTYKVPDDKNPDKAIDKEALVSKLKHHLIGDSPKILTEEAAAPWVKQIGDIHEEATKAPLTEWLEAAGLDGVAAGVEKIYEGKNFGVIWPYFLSAFMGLAVPALGLLLAAKSIDIVRNVTDKLFGWVIANNENGGWSRQNREDVERRERRVFNGGAGLADLPETPDFGPLRRQLEELNPHLVTFNDQAPSFIREFRKLPKESAATKAAAGVKKIADAIKDIDHTRMQPVATGVGKIQEAVRDADPRKIEKVAKATEKLKLATTNFNPDRVPKAEPLQDAATAAGNLARQIGPLDRALAGLRTTVGQLNTGLS
ncbi:hypothetical protein [Streptomyces sp. NPDC056527]|uniref:hypothetical protein n=1 Tax=Streptomyces sp. NPDC056527 TaxID=3345853 RepID=UPI0036AE6F15